jgi:hypothetical protein
VRVDRLTLRSAPDQAAVAAGFAGDQPLADLTGEMLAQELDERRAIVPGGFLLIAGWR